MLTRNAATQDFMHVYVVPRVRIHSSESDLDLRSVEDVAGNECTPATRSCLLQQTQGLMCLLLRRLQVHAHYIGTLFKKTQAYALTYARSGPVYDRNAIADAGQPRTHYNVLQ